MLWIVSILALTVIFRGFITEYWHSAWLILVVLFLLAVVDNVVLQASASKDMECCWCHWREWPWEPFFAQQAPH